MSTIDPTTSGNSSLPQTIPVPTGTRDVLPEEMAELREVCASALRTFTAAGYGEVATPALEFESSMQRGGASLLESAYRVADRDGQVLTLRFDSTVPIARLAATRYADDQPPLRFCYQQEVYRVVEPKRAQSRQFLQLGVELLGAEAPSGDAEVIELLVRTLEATGLRNFKIAVGDVAFFDRKLLDAGIGDALRAQILHELHTRDLVGARRLLVQSELAEDARDRLIDLATARGDRGLLERAEAQRLLELDEQLALAGVHDRVIYDLGLVRELDYYTGTVIEVYAPSIGFALGGGGRYDNLVGRFGRDLSACGFALNVEQLHLALLAEREATA